MSTGRELLYTVKTLIPFVRRVFPAVKSELAYWRAYAFEYAAQPLAGQAEASIRDKSFHCLGGSVYSLYPGVHAESFIRLIVSLQTISDYLDNLCDRVPCADPEAFRQLHLAVTDALDPAVPTHNYYQAYPAQEDGGYLRLLVETCRREVSKLPAYHLVKPQMLHYARLYSELQTYKHLDPAVREQITTAWAERHQYRYPEISCWEFAAATGSTLPLFALCALAANPRLTGEAASKLAQAYFPWISSWHILLDYLIDRQEDAAHGDLNFVAYYKNDGQAVSRLTYILQQAAASSRSTPDPLFTLTIVRGLTAMYLSDPKAQAEQPIARRLLAAADPTTRLMYVLCRLLRRLKVL